MKWRAVCVCAVMLLAACAGEGDGVLLDPADDRGSTTTSVGTSIKEAGTRHDPSLAAEIPAIDGVVFSRADPPDNYGDLLPVECYLVRRVIEVGGAPRGFLTVVAPPSEMAYEEFEDAVVDAFLAGPVDVAAGEVEGEGGTTMVSNPAPPRWATHGDEFVLEAVVAQDGSGRWAWFWNTRLWIVEGSADSQPVVEQLVRAQHQLAPPEDYDTLVIAGELTGRFADVADYWYIDLPRSDLISNLPDAVAGTCMDQWLVFGVATDPEDLLVDADNLVVELAVVGSRCANFPQDFRAFLMGLPGAHDGSIGATPVVIGDQAVGWVEDGIAFAASADSPATFATYRPFIEAFVQYQADQPAID